MQHNDISTVSIKFYRTNPDTDLCYEIKECPQHFTCRFSENTDGVVTPFTIEGEKQGSVYEAGNLLKCLEEQKGKDVILSPYERKPVKTLVYQESHIEARKKFFAEHLEKAKIELGQKFQERYQAIESEYNLKEAKEDIAEHAKQQAKQLPEKAGKISDLVEQHTAAIEQLQKLATQSVTEDEAKALARRALKLGIVIEDEKHAEHMGMFEKANLAVTNSVTSASTAPANNRWINHPNLLTTNIAVNGLSSFVLGVGALGGTLPSLSWPIHMGVSAITGGFTWGISSLDIRCLRTARSRNDYIVLAAPMILTLGATAIGIACEVNPVISFPLGITSLVYSGTRLLCAMQSYRGHGLFSRNNNRRQEDYQRLDGVAVVVPRTR